MWPKPSSTGPGRRGNPTDVADDLTTKNPKFMPPIVSILIVSYNSSAYISNCLDSIFKTTTVDYEIILVDNNSTDGTSQLVRLSHPDITVITNNKNVGFAAAVNQAARLAKARYLLLLNPDTVVHSGAIDSLITFVQSRPEAGACAPRTLRSDGTLRANCFTFVNPWSRFWTTVGIGPLQFMSRFCVPRPSWQITADVVQPVEAVSGAVLLISAELYWQSGGLDERFFMYYEDVDLCYQTCLVGYQNFYIPHAVVTHHSRHKITDHNVYLNGMIGPYSLQSQYHYILKYYGTLTMWILRILYGLVGLVLWGGANVFQHNSPKRNLYRDYGRLFALTPVPRCFVQKR